MTQEVSEKILGHKLKVQKLHKQLQSELELKVDDSLQTQSYKCSYCYLQFKKGCQLGNK